MIRTALVALLLFPALARAQAPPDASVLVETQPVRRGTLPDLVAAYGTAAPAFGGGLTLSLPQDGRVLAIAVTPGEQVRSGDKLIEFGASATTSSAFRQAQTALTLTQTERAHVAELLKQQLATRDQLAQADKAVSDARGTVDVLTAQGANRPRSLLTAPFDGIVGTIPVAQGDRVASGAALLTLTRLDGLVVTVGIEPGDRLRIRAGQAVELHRLSGGPALDGTVARIDGVLNPRTRMVDCDVSIVPGSVLSGEAFDAEITVGQLTGWIVPRGAVQVDDKGTRLFQVAADKAAAVAVSVIGARGQTDIVTGPLDPARPVIVVGTPQLTDGAAVRAAP